MNLKKIKVQVFFIVLSFCLAQSESQELIISDGNEFMKLWTWTEEIGNNISVNAPFPPDLQEKIGDLESENYWYFYERSAPTMFSSVELNVTGAEFVNFSMKYFVLRSNIDFLFCDNCATEGDSGNNTWDEIYLEIPIEVEIWNELLILDFDVIPAAVGEGSNIFIMDEIVITSDGPYFPFPVEATTACTTEQATSSITTSELTTLIDSTTTSEGPPTTTSEVPKTTSEVPTTTTSEVPTTTTSEVPTTTTSEVPTTTTSEVPTTTTSEVPTTTTSEVPTTTTSEVPTTITSEVPTTPTSEGSTTVDLSTTSERTTTIDEDETTTGTSTREITSDQPTTPTATTSLSVTTLTPGTNDGKLTIGNLELYEFILAILFSLIIIILLLLLCLRFTIFKRHKKNDKDPIKNYFDSESNTDSNSGTQYQLRNNTMFDKMSSSSSIGIPYLSRLRSSSIENSVHNSSTVSDGTANTTPLTVTSSSNGTSIGFVHPMYRGVRNKDNIILPRLERYN